MAMNNNHLKQFPMLMAGKKVMYVHGFGSSAQSGTVALLRHTLPQTEVVAYDLPVVPQEAMALLRQRCQADNPDLIVGTSMGGMYAEMLYGFDRVLVNPAFRMGETMRAHNLMGLQHFQNLRQDGVQEFLVNKSTVKAYQEMTEQCFSAISSEEKQRVFGLFGRYDDLVDTYDLFLRHYPNAIRFDGGHRLDDSALLHSVIPVIRWIDDRQNHTERPLILVQVDTLRDGAGNTASAAMKALEFLAENYRVCFLAGSPTTDAEYTSRVRLWVDKHMGVLAFNRLTFTNQREMLLADYLIARAECDDFIGTTVIFGSEETKTWEEVHTYFSRLGGQ